MRRFAGLLLLLTAVGAACSGNLGEPLSSEPGSASTGGFPASLAGDWKTDFTKASVSPEELTRGQTKDGIPAISQPRFLAVPKVDFLGAREPVIAFELGGEARAYPLQILTWHEIVNDVVADRPVLITFCPLCNTAIAFDRTVGGETLEFGVSGFLRKSDLVMFDRKTESWWQQVTGEAIVGELTGTRLEFLPSSIVSWADFKASFPEGRVLSRETGFRREYGRNPYVGYDDIDSSPFLFSDETDSRLAPKERVVTVELDGEVRAYPFRHLEANPVVSDSVGGTDIVIFFKPGTASVLDGGTIADSRDVGATAVFESTIDGQALTFRADDGFVDNETGSRWDIFGRATAGALSGKTLAPVISGNHFWFAWAAFKPETRVWTPQ